jgi:OOP family OmpA-OmpF porin
MKKIILSVSLIILGNAYAQDAKFNRLAIDANVGFNQPMAPRNTKSYGENTGFDRLKDFSLNLGGRYSLSNKFGAGLYFGYNTSGNRKDDNTSSFITISTQGFVNLSNLLGFESIFNNKFRVLAHAGPGIGILSNSNSKFDKSDKMLLIAAGLTPQYKINDKLTLNLEFQAIATYFQNRTWDFNSRPSSLRRGILAQATVGVSYYAFGPNKDKVHADWYSEESDIESKLTELKNKIAAAEAKLVDTDKDGVADYLDIEPNTPEGSVVNTKGQRIVDMDGDGIVDTEDYCPTVKGTVEFKGCPTAMVNTSNTKSESNDEASEEVSNLPAELKTKFKNITSDVQFGVNSDKVKPAFVKTLTKLAKQLNENKNVKVSISGHADNVGEESVNNSLSESRAVNVKNILVSKGVDASRITTKGYGDKKPKASNDTEKGRNINRRVEIITTVK